MEKRKAVLDVLKRSPNVPFTPNEIAIILKNENKNMKIHHPEVLRILLEEYARNPEEIGYKKVARVHLFWFKRSEKKSLKGEL